MSGNDAFDWIKGLRPWSQFLDYCDTVAQIDGSRLQAAQLNDERFLAEIEKLLHQKQQKYRPSLEGDTAEIKAIRQLSNDIRLFLRVQGVQLPFLEGPEGPADRIRARKRAIGRARLAEIRGTDM